MENDNTDTDRSTKKENGWLAETADTFASVKNTQIGNSPGILPEPTTNDERFRYLVGHLKTRDAIFGLLGIALLATVAFLGYLNSEPGRIAREARADISSIMIDLGAYRGATLGCLTEQGEEQLTCLEELVAGATREENFGQALAILQEAVTRNRNQQIEKWCVSVTYDVVKAAATNSRGLPSIADIYVSVVPKICLGVKYTPQ